MSARWRVWVADVIGLVLTIALVVSATTHDWGGWLLIVVGLLLAVAYVLLILVPMLIWQQTIERREARP